MSNFPLDFNSKIDGVVLSPRKDCQTQVSSSPCEITMDCLNNISISVCACDVNPEDRDTYRIIFSMNGATSEVLRTYKDFEHFLFALKKNEKLPLPVLPRKDEYIDIKLEQFLQNILSLKPVWMSAPFLRFFDEPKISIAQQLQLRSLQEQLLYQQQCYNDVACQLQISQAHLFSANETINDLRRRLELIETVLSAQNLIATNTPLNVRSNTMQHGIDTPYRLSPSLSNSRQEEGVQSPYRTKRESPEDLSGRRVSYTGRLFGIVEEIQATEQTGAREDNDTLHEFSRDSCAEKSVDEILRFVVPQITSLYYRSSVEKYISVLVSKSLGAQVHEMGLHSLGCFLPDDPLNLAIFLCRGLENSWYIRLNEKLCRMSSSNLNSKSLSESDNSENVSADVGTLGSFETEGYLHTVKNVSFVNENGEYRLQCIVDSITVDIRINSKLDLCFVTFLEELDRCIGNDHLFKRSLLLIKAWWKYEASSFNKISSPGLLLPNSALCIMICGVFSMYRKNIQHPLHCLYFFLSEYSSFDWESSSATVYGSVHGDERPIAHDTGIISRELISKYEMMVNNSDLFRTHDNVEGNASTLQGLMDMERGEDMQLLSEKTFSSDLGSQYMRVYHPLDPVKNVIPQTISASEVKDIVQVFQYGAQMIRKAVTSDDADSTKLAIMEMFGETCARFACGNRPDSFHVPHVATPIDRRLSINSASSSVLDIGSDALSHERRSSVTSTGGDFLLHDVSEDRYDEIVLVYNTSRDPMFVPLEKLHDRIRFCNSLLESQVTEEALRTLSKDILIERGPLPVGEIGKMLQEITNITSLSTFLKEKFGGLKKFLENYDCDFVISFDHPFNPHVYLRSTLTREDMASVLQGISPPHLANKSSKRRNSRKKKSVSLTPTFTRVVSGDYGSVPPYSQQVNNGSGSTNSLIPFNMTDGASIGPGVPRNANFFPTSASHGYSSFASLQGHSTGDIPGLMHGNQIGAGQPRGKVKSKSVHDVSYHYVNSFLETQAPTRERNSSEHRHMYAIGDSHLGRLGLPDPDAPVFIPGFFR